MADVDIGTIYEEVGVAEDVTVDIPIFISKYESVTVSETVTLLHQICWQFNGMTPIWELSAEFGRTLQLDAKLPVLQLSGQFGYRLNKTAPVMTLSGTMYGSIPFSVNSKLPTWSLESQSGFRLNAKIPTLGLSSSFVLSYNASLNKRIPLLIFEGSMYPDGVFSLDKIIPVRSLSATMAITSDVWQLAKNIPGAMRLAGSMYTGSGITLDKLIPLLELSATMFDGDFDFDEKIPFWKLSALMLETKPAVHPDVSITDDSFVGVLRYIRP